MSTILRDVEPWIAKAVFEAITFDPQTISKLNRESHLAQVVKSPQIIDNQDNNGDDDARLFHLVISDGLNSIPVYVKMQRRKLDKIESGVLVRIPFKHWSISHTSLMRQYPRQNGRGSLYQSGPFCIVLYQTELIVDTKHTTGDDEADTRNLRSNNRPRPCIETIACGGMGIAGPPIDVHSTISIRRALIAIPSNFQRLRQIVDCFNYSLTQNDDPKQVDKKFIPSPDLVVVARLDEYPTPKIIHALVEVNRMYEKEKSRLEMDATPTVSKSKMINTPKTTQQHVDVSGLMSPGTPLAYQTACHAQSPHPIQGITQMLDSYSSDEDEKCGDESEQDETLKENLESDNGKRASRRLAKRGVRNEAERTPRNVNEKVGRHDEGEKDQVESQDREKEDTIEDISESVDIDDENDSHHLDTQPAQHVNIGEQVISNQTRNSSKATSIIESPERNSEIGHDHVNEHLETQPNHEFHLDNDESDQERVEGNRDDSHQMRDRVSSTKPSLQEKAPSDGKNEASKDGTQMTNLAELRKGTESIMSGSSNGTFISLVSNKSKESQKPVTSGRRFRLADLVRKRKPAKDAKGGNVVKKKKFSKKKRDPEKKKSSFDILDWMKE